MTVPAPCRDAAVVARSGEDAIVGAGTVLDAETARACILAGARFVVSPALDLATIALCRRYSVAVMPGALTPTEVVSAWTAGADVVKVFPAARWARQLHQVAEGAAAPGRALPDGRRLAEDRGRLHQGRRVRARRRRRPGGRERDPPGERCARHERAGVPAHSCAKHAPRPDAGPRPRRAIPRRHSPLDLPKGARTMAIRDMLLPEFDQETKTRAGSWSGSRRTSRTFDAPQVDAAGAARGHVAELTGWVALTLTSGLARLQTRRAARPSSRRCSSRASSCSRSSTATSRAAARRCQAQDAEFISRVAAVGGKTLFTLRRWRCCAASCCRTRAPPRAARRVPAAERDPGAFELRPLGDEGRL